MQEIIKQIIEIDKKAQDMTDEAISMKQKAEHEIKNEIDTLREKYMQRAQRRIQVTSDTEQRFLDETLQSIKSKYDNKKSVLNDDYEKNHTIWAGEIYKRVIGG